MASCAFGSPHLKQFRLLTKGLDTEFLTVRCRGGRGKLTKPSAVYVPALAKHFATAFARGLKRVEEEVGATDGHGLESVVINDVLAAGEWKTEHEWQWQTHFHINVLESLAYVSLLKRLARHESRALRFPALLDSRVAKGAHAKGRTASRVLQPGLHRAAAITVGAGLYPSFGFAPTRLNVAEDHTRDAPLREPSLKCCLVNLDFAQLQSLHACQFKRPFANWIRIFLLLTSFQEAFAFPPDVIKALSSIFPQVLFLLPCSSLSLDVPRHWLLPVFVDFVLVPWLHFPSRTCASD